MKRRRSVGAALLASVLCCLAGQAEADDWPQHLGPTQDAVSPETGLLEQWPEQGPAELWRHGVGQGYAGVAVVDGQVFLNDRNPGVENILRVFDLDTGEELWRYAHKAPGRANYPGSRSTPCVTDTHVYTTGPMGHIAAINRETHQPDWQFNINERYPDNDRRFGYGSSIIVVDGVLLLSPSKEGDPIVVALDPKTGETRWESEAKIQVSMNHHHTPVVREINGVRGITTRDRTWVYHTEIKTGKTVWSYNALPMIRGPHVTIPSVTVFGDNGQFVFVNSGYQQGSVLLEVTDAAAKGQTAIREVYRMEDGGQVHPPILVDGHLYLNTNENANLRGRNPDGGLACIVAKTGKIKWKTGNAPNLNRGAVTFADGKLYVYDDEAGELLLVNPSPEKFDLVSKFVAITPKRSKNEAWAPIVVSDGRVIIRDHQQIVCFDPTAPLEHDHHTHKHNPPHKTVPAGDDRFHTNREGAALDLPAEEDAFSFVIFGDRTGGPHKGINVLAQAVADTNLIEPDLVMTVGDLIDGYADDKVWLPQMKQYKEVMGELICPWFPVAGNHDVYWRGPNKPERELEPLYEMHFGPLWYAFEHKGCFFIVLYTDEGDPKTGLKNFKQPKAQTMSDEQFDWLKGILKKAGDADHVFVFVHHPRWLGNWPGKVGYGDDWKKVHKALVDAGNVSGVFAGHIHHMRHDPKDGINYFTLATVGGHQPGWAPKAGWLHHFNLVTVRKNQVAFSALPVGGVMDPKALTGDVSEASEVLGRAMPARFKAPIKIKDDGSVDDEFTVVIKNPSDQFAIDIELVPTSKDSRWLVAIGKSDHAHANLKPGEEKELTFQVKRAPGKFDTTARAIILELGIDLLTEQHRFPIPIKRITVPGSLRVDVE
eukprot:g12369.t1